MIVSKIAYTNNVLGQGNNEDLLTTDLTFNEKNGMYDKTTAWDETYVLLSEDILPLEGEAIMEEGKNNKLVATQAHNIAILARIAEEGEHSLQNYIDGTKKIKGGNGIYINPGRPNKNNTLSYKQRKHEKEAKAKAKKTVADYVKSNNITLSQEQLNLINRIINGE